MLLFLNYAFVFVQLAEDENVAVDSKFRALVAVGSLVILNFYLMCPLSTVAHQFYFYMEDGRGNGISLLLLYRLWKSR